MDTKITQSIKHGAYLLLTGLVLLLPATASAQFCTPSYISGCSGDGDDINTFTLTGANSTSINDPNTGCSNNAYDNRTFLSVNLLPGNTYNGSINTEYMDEAAEIFIDLNGDNVFSASESVGGVNYIDDIGVSFSITIPASAAPGTRRMRVVLSYDFLYPGIDPCPTASAGYDYGETHDYTAIIGTGTSTGCAAPVGLSATGVTSSNAILAWSPVSAAQGYEYALNQSSTPPTSAGTPTTTTSYPASGLSASTAYYFHVRTKCSATSFSSWSTQSFTTQTASGCNPPASVSVSSISSSSATFTWPTVSGAIGYEYVIDQAPGNPAGSGTLVTSTPYTDNSLSASTTYYFHVRTKCSATSFSSWTTQSFTTNNNTGCVAPATLTVTNILFTTATIGWSPVSGAVGYEYAVQTSGTPPSGAGTPTTSVSVNVGGLTANANYYLFVRTKCSASTYSPWASKTFKASPVGVGTVAGPDAFRMSAWPNPVKDVLTVRLEGARKGTATLTLTDLSGRMLQIATVTGAEVSLKLNALPTGFYLIRYADGEQSQVIRVFKQ